jgi:hypothetical protein
MKGPFRRIRPGRRPADDPGQQQDPQATLIVPPPAAPGTETAPTAAMPPTAEPPTAVGPPAPTPEPLPAGMAPEDVAPTRPSFRDRARLRRRMRYLRRVRELGFRDLGGLAFDLHRFRRRNDELVLGKLAALDAVDRELRAIERVLDERRDIIELREPGVAACPRCGALHGSDANFCPQCGTQLSGPRAIVEVGGAAAAAAPSGPEVSPAQEALPFSGAEQVSTPVSGALAGNPPPPAPPEPPPAPRAEAPGAAQDPASANAPTDAPGVDATSGATPTTPTDVGTAPAPASAPGDPAEQPTTVQPASGLDQPTQAFPALGGDDEHGSALTSGDPLASRERSAE